MNTHQQDIIVRNGAAHFTRSACSVFKDMMNVEFSLEKKSANFAPFSCKNVMTVISHFSGRVQGDYMLSIDEATAAKIAGVYNPENGFSPNPRLREIYAGMMCEVLNVSAQTSVVELARDFGNLTVLPPAWIFGEYHMADFVSGVGMIDSLFGRVQCCFVLNMVTLNGIKFS
jgi:CheY-specific phosphatase CheX